MKTRRRAFHDLSEYSDTPQPRETKPKTVSSPEPTSSLSDRYPADEPNCTKCGVGMEQKFSIGEDCATYIWQCPHCKNIEALSI